MPRRPETDRRDVLLGAAAAPFAGAAGEPASGIAARIDAMAAAGRLANLHGIVVLRAGRMLFERYLAGPDNAWGRPLGEVAFGPETLHDLRSVTKSIVGLLYGIALAESRVPPPEAPLLAQFPEYQDLAADARRARLTVHHALSMTLGTAWDESLPYSDPANSEIAMERAADRLRFVLDRPMVAEPGSGWSYNGGATALLGALIARGTGQALPDYGRARLFAPLGLGPTEWAAGPDGVAAAASGLRMTPRDLARIGLMVLADGAWEGRAVVPAEWLARSVRPAATLPDGRRYGYQWYVGRWPRQAGVIGRSDRWLGAIGNGGQRLHVFPDLDLVVAVTAGAYNRPEQWEMPLALLWEAVLPAIWATEERTP